jgi:general secretion pathway protein G
MHSVIPTDRKAPRGAPTGTQTNGGAGDARRAARRVAERGFSLLEVLVVLVIIAMVATLVGPRLLSQIDKSKTATARIQIKALASALDTMHLDIGRYPTDPEGLGLLSAPGASEQQVQGWLGPYLDGQVPADPWNRPYVYRAPADGLSRPVIVSLGSDGKEGGSGSAADVSSADPG